MFSKVLIANRGEIAVRVMRACREMGITSVAVFSDVDRASLHVSKADEAYLLGPAPARESYLNIAKILEVARKCGAEAIHPGYGFLSENARFAHACAEAGIKFIGPPPSAMELMGSKTRARTAMKAAGVPMVPGSVRGLSIAEAEAMGAEIGYPVMIKAAAGGGGKGMRLVASPRISNPVLKRPKVKRCVLLMTAKSTLKNLLRTRATLRSRCLATSMAMWFTWASASAPCNAAIKR